MNAKKSTKEEISNFKMTSDEISSNNTIKNQLIRIEDYINEIANEMNQHKDFKILVAEKHSIHENIEHKYDEVKTSLIFELARVEEYMKVTSSQYRAENLRLFLQIKELNKRHPNYGT